IGGARRSAPLPAAGRSGLGPERADVGQDRLHLGLREHTLPAWHRALPLMDRRQELLVGAGLHVRHVVEVSRLRLEALGAHAVAVAVCAVTERAALGEHLGAEIGRGPGRSRWSGWRYAGLGRRGGWLAP